MTRPRKDNEPMQRITTVEAAERLGLSRFRIFQFIKGKRLPAVKVGRDWLIDPIDLKLVEDRRPGRPAKKATAKKLKKSWAIRSRSIKTGRPDRLIWSPPSILVWFWWLLFRFSVVLSNVPLSNVRHITLKRVFVDPISSFNNHRWSNVVFFRIQQISLIRYD